MSEYIAHPADENLRIKVGRDMFPSKPYNDGGFPIWRIESAGFGTRAVQETDITSYVTPHELDYAIGQLWFHGGARYTSEETLARYLRIFWGVTFVETWHSGSFWYVTCDPAEWRKEVGVDEEITKRGDYTEGAFTEWQAWVEGDVWVATEQRRIFVRSHHQTWDLAAGHDPDLHEPSDDDTTEAFEWVDTDNGSVGGFYGDVDREMEKVMMWQFGWPEAVCKHCGEGITRHHVHGWYASGEPSRPDDAERYTHCATGVMMHTRGPKHEPKER